MGLVGVLAQSALDFLVEERCHACGAVTGRSPARALPSLAAPVDVLALPRFRLTSRLLCPACAARVRRRGGPVTLVPRGPTRGDALTVHAAFVTDERLLAVIHLMKFGRRERIAPWLARAMLAGLPAFRPAHEGHDGVVVPVPMDRAARRRRGFNQAESMARTLAREWRVPVMPRAVEKIRATVPQSVLGRDERLVNLDGAFVADPSMVRDRRIVLVDDLVTTGATVGTCAHALRRAGAREVSVVCAGYRDDFTPLPKPLLQS